MGEQPAKWLARLKVQHSLWTIRQIPEGFGYGFEASKPGPVKSGDDLPPYGNMRLWAMTLTDLERLLRAADKPQGRRTT